MTRSPRPSLPSQAFENLRLRLSRFRIREEIAHGGSSVIFRVYDEDLDRQLALKVIVPGRVKTPSPGRVLEEARNLAKVNHPAILHVYGAGEVSGLHYILLQYVRGQTLDRHIEQHAPLPCLQSLQLIEQAAEALNAAHQHDLIHRDVKPSNLLLSDCGLIYLMDFGIAVDPSDTTPDAAGTFLYSSPEQNRQLRLDVRTDIYSLGVVLYQLLTGTLPMVASSAQEMCQRMSGEKYLPIEELRPELPESVCRLVSRMLCADLSQRITTMHRVQEEIRTIRGHLENADRSPKSSLKRDQPIFSSRTHRWGGTKYIRLLGAASCLIMTMLISQLWMGNVLIPSRTSLPFTAPDIVAPNVLVSIAPIQHPTNWVDREQLLDKLESDLREQLVRERGVLFRTEDKALYRIEPSVSMLPPHSAQLTLLVRRISTGSILFGESLVGKQNDLSRMLHNLSEMLIHRIAQMRSEKPSP